MVFGAKMANSPTFLLGNLGHEYFFYDILIRKNAFLGYKNKKFKKSKNSHFSKRVNPWFWPKNGHFSNFCFLGKKGHENVFQDILEQKKPFQAIKTTSSKTRKIDIFPKGLTHGFGPKIAIFPTFISQEIYARKMSFMIFWNKKTPFQTIKTRSLKSRKIFIFPKRLTHGFGPKMAIFPIFFFRQCRPEQSLLRYSRTEKHLSRL